MFKSEIAATHKHVYRKIGFDFKNILFVTNTIDGKCSKCRQSDSSSRQTTNSLQTGFQQLQSTQSS